jgi:hypothetical protein
MDYPQKVFTNSINSQCHKIPSSLTRAGLKINDRQHDEDKVAFGIFEKELIRN